MSDVIDNVKLAIEVAESNGWKNIEGVAPIDIMGYVMLNKKHLEPTILFSCSELLFNHEFTKALWGDDLVDNHGQSMKVIRAWANQVAVKHLGKLHAVEQDKPYATIFDMPEMDFSKPPDSLVEGTKIEYKLQKMAASLQFETHQLQPIEIDADTQPLYIWHMMRMATYPEPECYLSVLNLPKAITELAT